MRTGAQPVAAEDVGDLTWQARAICADDPDWHRLTQLDQKRICIHCPVHTECLNYALKHVPGGKNGDASVWGGYNGNERTRKLRKLGQR